jgi:hypothetical protein
MRLIYGKVLLNKDGQRDERKAFFKRKDMRAQVPYKLIDMNAIPLFLIW